MAIWLSPLTPLEEKRKFYGYDIETANNGILFVSATLYFSDERKHFFLDKQLIINFFKKRFFRKKIIISTNSLYDWGGTFANTPEEMEFKLVMRGSRLLSAKTYITPKGFNRNNGVYSHPAILEFWDTLNFAAQSVEDMGKLLSLPKMIQPQCFGRFPETIDEMNELIDYNMRDSEISKKFVQYLRTYLQELNCPMRMTIASCAMAYFRTNHLHDNFIQPDEKTLLEQFETYYGGRTEVIERGEHFGLNYYDVNSLYPFMMATNVFPNPNTMQHSSRNSDDKIMMYEGYSQVKVFCPEMHLPLLPYHAKDGKLIFPTGTFIGRYTHVELREALKLGYSIEYVYESTYYKETVKPFAFMQTLFNERLRFKNMKTNEGDFMAFTMKLLSNSMYGKFAQRFKEMDVFEPFNLTAIELDNIQGHFERIGNYYRMKQDGEPSSFCVPIWSSYVTAYARILIHKLAVKHKAVYLDTDSILTHDEISASNDFGALKLEAHLPKSIFVRPKFYVMQDSQGKTSYKIKGIAMKMITNFAGETMNKVMYEDFRKLVLQPRIEFKRFRKMRESKRSGLPLNEVFQTCKKLSLEDEKRVWNGSFPKSGSQKSVPIQL